MKKLAVFDVDDTLFNLRDPMSLALNQATGKNITHSEWLDYNIHELYGINFSKFLDILTNRKVLEKCQPEPACERLLNNLSKDFYIVLVTARGWHYRGAEITEHQFKMYGIPFSELHCLDMCHDKADFIKETYGKVDLFVEDNPVHFDNVLKEKIAEKSLLLERPWNEEYRIKKPLSIKHSIEDLSEITDILSRGKENEYSI